VILKSTSQRATYLARLRRIRRPTRLGRIHREDGCLSEAPQRAEGGYVPAALEHQLDGGPVSPRGPATAHAPYSLSRAPVHTSARRRVSSRSLVKGARPCACASATLVSARLRRKAQSSSQNDRTVKPLGAPAHKSRVPSFELASSSLAHAIASSGAPSPSSATALATSCTVEGQGVRCSRIDHGIQGGCASAPPETHHHI